jgi:hypothetical protein
MKTVYKDRVLNVIPDTFDFLHIDCSNQTYEDAKSALDKYFPQVRSGGFVMGSDVKDDVTKAFSEFIAKNNLTGAGADERIFFKKVLQQKPVSSPKRSIAFVTKFTAKGMSNNDTLKYLLALFSFKQDLIVFTDSHLISDLTALNNKIIFVSSDSVTNTLDQKYIKFARQIDPNVDYSEHNKINLLREAKNINSDYILYAWVDCNAQMSPNKFNNMRFATNKLSFYSSASDSSNFVIPNSLLDSIEVLYEYKLIEMQTRWIANQSIFAQMHHDFPGMFSLI